jgi:hypothetical protein
MSYEIAFQTVKDSYSGTTDGNIFNESGTALLRNSSQLRPYGWLWQVEFARLDSNHTKVVIKAIPSWNGWAKYEAKLLNGRIIKDFTAGNDWYNRK